MQTQHQRRLAPIFLLGLAGFLSQFDVTALAVALPAISDALRLTTAGGAWVIDAYSLSFAAALLPAGFLADGWGRRRVLMVGLALFAVASAGCALATTGVAMWAWRAAQGGGAALLTCSMLALLGGLYRETGERMWAFGWVGIIVGVAMIAGPAGGGLLATWLGWQAIFWINPPLCALIFAASWFWLDEQRGELASRAGLALVLTGVLAIVGLVWSLLESGQRGWTSPLVAGPGLVSLALMAFLALRISGTSTRDHVHPGFVVAAGVAALQSVGYWATLVYLPLAATQWFRIEATQAGLLLLAATAPMLLLPRYGARLAQRHGLRALFASGLGIIALGDALIWHTSAQPSFGLTSAGMLIAGCGAGLMNAQLSGAFVTLAQARWAGMASALGITMRQLGYALGVALLGAVANTGGHAFSGSFAVAGLAAAAGALLALRIPRLTQASEKP